MKTDQIIKRSITKYLIPILFLSISCILAACGQKGPLFLPEPDRASKPEPVASIKQTNTEVEHTDMTLEKSGQPNNDKEKSSDKPKPN